MKPTKDKNSRSKPASSTPLFGASWNAKFEVHPAEPAWVRPQDSSRFLAVTLSLTDCNGQLHPPRDWFATAVASSEGGSKRPENLLALFENRNYVMEVTEDPDSPEGFCISAKPMLRHLKLRQLDLVCLEFINSSKELPIANVSVFRGTENPWWAAGKLRDVQNKPEAAPPADLELKRNEATTSDDKDVNKAAKRIAPPASPSAHPDQSVSLAPPAIPLPPSTATPKVHRPLQAEASLENLPPLTATAAFTMRDGNNMPF